MDTLFSTAAGFGLRIICINLPQSTTSLAPAFIGLWEGVLSHLVLSLNPDGGQSNTDHLLAYGLRLVFDLVLTQNPSRPLLVALWTGVSLLLCQAIDHQSRPHAGTRRKRSRRHQNPGIPPLPSHVRVYQPPLSQPDRDTQIVSANPPAQVATPFPDRPSTPPSFFLQGEQSEISYFSPAPNPPPPPIIIPPQLPPRSTPRLEPDESSAQEKPVALPSPPPTSVSAGVDKDSTDSDKRLSTIIEASSGEEVSATVILAALATGGDQLRNASASMERKELDQSGARTTSKTETVPLPVPNPCTLQTRQNAMASAQASVAADPPPPTVISVNTSSATRFLFRPYNDEEAFLDEFQTPLNPVSRALLEDDVNHVLTDGENDPLQTPLSFARQLADGPLSPLSPLLSVQMRLNTLIEPSQYGEAGTDLGPSSSAANARLARRSLLMSSEAEPESPESEADSSILSTLVPKELYVHGDDWRKKAREEEKRYAELKKEYEKAMKELRVRDALVLKGQISESDAKIRRLHEKAAKRYYKARNTPGQAQLIDLHGLRVQEALEITERALRTALISGNGTLKVITGKGLHSKNKLPVLKYALIRAMEQQKIPCEPDPSNPGALILSLPP